MVARVLAHTRIRARTGHIDLRAQGIGGAGLKCDQTDDAKGPFRLRELCFGAAAMFGVLLRDFPPVLACTELTDLGQLRPSSNTLGWRTRLKFVIARKLQRSDTPPRPGGRLAASVNGAGARQLVRRRSEMGPFPGRVTRGMRKG